MIFIYIVNKDVFLFISLIKMYFYLRAYQLWALSIYGRRTCTLSGRACPSPISGCNWIELGQSPGGRAFSLVPGWGSMRSGGPTLEQRACWLRADADHVLGLLSRKKTSSSVGDARKGTYFIQIIEILLHKQLHYCIKAEWQFPQHFRYSNGHQHCDWKIIQVA